VSDEQVAEVIERTLNATPKDTIHWSTRSMAAEMGPFAHDDPTDLGGVLAAPAPGGDLQAVD